MDPNQAAVSAPVGASTAGVSQDANPLTHRQLLRAAFSKKTKLPFSPSKTHKDTNQPFLE